MNYVNLCYNCFCEKPIPDRPCVYCGFNNEPSRVRRNCLTPGTVLNNRYVVGVALGVGGFGITYKCYDNNVGGICAIKEYFPSSYAERQQGQTAVYVSDENKERYNHVLKRFVEESKMLKTLHHPNIIRTFDSFMQNNTAYYVMEYCNGVDLRTYTSNFKKKLDGNIGFLLLRQVMDGLEYIHGKNILHRDIAPDNIFVTQNNSVKILDFGAARREMDQDKRQLSTIVKMGYAPIEQYSGKSKQGSYTDIYALGATFYHLFTGVTPVESTQRAAGSDELVPLSRMRPDLPSNVSYCIEKALAVFSKDRIQTVSDMRYVLGISGFQYQSVNPNPSVGSSVRIATILERSVAHLVDSVISGFFGFACVLTGIVTSSVAGVFAGFLLILLTQLAYGTLMEIFKGATLGKMLMGLYVRGGQNEKADNMQIALRNVIKLLGVFCLIPVSEGMMLQEKLTSTAVCSKSDPKI